MLFYLKTGQLIQVKVQQNRDTISQEKLNDKKKIPHWKKDTERANRFI